MRVKVYAGLTRLVQEGRLRYPKEVVTELSRYEGRENPALQWAKANEDLATAGQPGYDRVKEVLAEVPEILDAAKEGVEEADPYVLAMALELSANVDDVRVVTEEFKTTVAKMPLGSAAGFLNVPSLSLRAMLKFERIIDEF